MSKATTCRIDLDSKGGLDDLAISGDLITMVRLERMDKGGFWGAVYFRDGRDLRMWFSADKGKLAVSAEFEGPATHDTGGGV